MKRNYQAQEKEIHHLSIRDVPAEMRWALKRDATERRLTLGQLINTIFVEYFEGRAKRENS